jgi:NADH-quinone oxidoreductase subunit L
MNRVGDFGFVLGIIAIWAALGSISFLDLERTLAADPRALGRWRVAGAGVHGGDGQERPVPLHVWLPDAMEVRRRSAPDHAATMVAAGVCWRGRSSSSIWRGARRAGLAGRVSALDIIAGSASPR